MKSPHVLGVALLVLSSTACNGLQPTPGTGPFAPTPVVVPPPTPPVQPSTPFTVSLGIVTPQQTATQWIWQAHVFVTPTLGTVSPALPASVEVNCGTGPTQRRDGFYGVDVFTCMATTEGTFETRATARSASGFAAQATTNVSVTPTTSAPFTLSLQVVGPGPVQELGGGERARAVTFSVLVTPDARLAQSYEFDFGDGSKTGEISNHTQTHYYTKAGTYEAVVSVKSTDGRNAKVVRRLDITF